MTYADFMTKLLKRLSEPSTWAGMGGLAMALGYSPQEWHEIVLAITGVAGFILAVALGEKGEK